MLSMLLFSLLGMGAALAAGSVVATTLLYSSDWQALAREMRGHNEVHHASVGPQPLPRYREAVNAFGGAGTGFRTMSIPGPVAVRPRHEPRAAA